ncbi:MAG: FAD-dependent oxidoreductase [Betaproteobacteria bacterium]
MELRPICAAKIRAMNRGTIANNLNLNARLSDAMTLSAHDDNKNAGEILVIGAGVIGLACALRLAQEGKNVVLVDRDPPGMGASFGNAGHIATEQVYPMASPEVVRHALKYLLDSESPLRIRPAYLATILPWLMRFAWNARRAPFERGVAALTSLQATATRDLADLLATANAAHMMHTDGHLVLVEDTRSITAAKQEIKALARFGIEAEWIAPAHVRDIAPEITADIQGALKFSGTGHVDDPHEICNALLHAFQNAGGKFVQAGIDRIEDGERFIATAGNGRTFSATQLVLSCGAWSKTLAAQLGYSVPLEAERGYHLTLPGVTPRFRIPVASYERKVIMTPMSCGLRMTGTVEFGGLQLPPDPRRFALLAHHMAGLAAGLPTENAGTWMGFRPSLPDHLPVLGRVPDGRNIFFAFGHQHLGLTLAGVTARVIAAQMGGRDPGIDLSPFAADRF